MAWRFFIEWCVEPPARLLAYLILCALGFGVLFALHYVWHWTGYFLNDPGFDKHNMPGRPTKLTTWIICVVVGFYAFMVMGFALTELPSTAAIIMKSEQYLSD
jgi:hypothetical protein